MDDGPTPPGVPGPATDRVALRRGAHRGDHRRDAIVAILDAGHVAHVGVVTVAGPLVLPMAYGHDGNVLYLHGASANHLLGAAAGAEVCATVTLVDGIVVARSPFHNSMNYRSVVVRGLARRVEGEEKLVALKLISDHVVENFDAGRPPTGSEIRRTLVVAVPLGESSAKVRVGDPIDEAADLDGPWWAGVIPVETVLGDPLPAGDLGPGDAAAGGSVEG